MQWCCYIRLIEVFPEILFTETVQNVCIVIVLRKVFPNIAIESVDQKVWYPYFCGLRILVFTTSPFHRFTGFMSADEIGLF